MDKAVLLEPLRTEFMKGTLRKTLFPMLTDFGIRDYSENVHSHGLNYLTAIGRSIEHVSAISECPVYPQKYARTVRPDSVWFDARDMSPLLLCEFERFEKTREKRQKLQEKVENLLVGYHQLGSRLPVILFVCWSLSSITLGEISRLTGIFDRGFTLPDGQFVPGINSVRTSYLICHCIATGSKDCLKFNNWIRIV